MHARSVLSRRSALRLFGVTAIGGVLVACSAPATPSAGTPASAGAPSTKPNPTSPAPAAGNGQPRAGGTLRLGVVGDLPNLDGHFINGDNTIYPIWDRLVELDANLNPTPLLAESWDASSDYMQIKLNLRKSVKWHTGREFTSDDVSWNLNRLKTDKTVDGGAVVNLLSPLTSIETPDKNTVILKAEKPWPAAFSMLAFKNMIDPVSFQGPDGANKPVGTGPFTFAEWIQGDHFTLKKNANYWQTGKPYVDGITIRIYNDPQAMVTQLQGSAVDAVIAPPITSVADLQKDPKYKVVVNKQTGASTILVAQCKDPTAPTGNKLFRQAVNWATDRQRIVETAYLGFGEIRDLPFPSNSPAYDETRNRQYAFNLEKAKSLLAQSGITNPTVDFMWSTATPDVANIAQILQSDLAKIGITLNLKATEPVAALNALFNSTFTGLFGATILLGQLHPSVMNGSPYYSAGYNWCSFHSDDLARVDDAILRAADPSKAKDAFSAWSDYVLDQSFAMPISAQYPHFLTSAKVDGMSFDVAGDWITTNDAWLSA